MMKRNDETKRRNEMTKSLGDNTGAVLCNIYISQPLGHSTVPGYHIYMFPAENYFPDLSHINIQGVKIHTVGNHATTPAPKRVHVDHQKLGTK